MSECNGSSSSKSMGIMPIGDHLLLFPQLASSVAGIPSEGTRVPGGRHSHLLAPS